MAKLDLVDIAPELLQKVSYRSKHKQQFNTEVMQKVADHMNLKPCEDAQFSQVIQLNDFGPDGQYSHHRQESIALLCHISAGTVKPQQATG
jgi:hypothetical protein